MTIPAPLLYLLPLGLILAMLWIAAGGEGKPGSFRKRFAVLVLLVLVAPVVLAASLSTLAKGLGLGRIGSVAGMIGFFTPWAVAAFFLVRWWIAARDQNGIKDLAGEMLDALLHLVPSPLRKFAGKLRIKSNRSLT